MSFAIAAPPSARLRNARGAVSVGGRDQAADLVASLSGPGAADLADAGMRAVLALHDDQVLDAGRAVTEAITLESDHIWIELRPDLLELAAVVASRCNDHQRALVLLAAGERARVEAEVGFRFRDQQAWIDNVLAAATSELTLDQITELRLQGSSMSTDDALAYARRGSGERRRPPTAGTPSHPPNDASSNSSPKASPTRRSPTAS